MVKNPFVEHAGEIVAHIRAEHHWLAKVAERCNKNTCKSRY
jgi:hypothetical protein